MIFLDFKFSNVVFSMLIHVKIPTIFGILTFMRMIDYMLNLSEYEKFCNLGPVLSVHTVLSLVTDNSPS